MILIFEQILIVFYIFSSQYAIPPEYSEDSEEEDYAQEVPAVKSSDRKQREGFYKNIFNHINGKIYMGSEGRHRSLVNIEGDPKLILNPSWEGSWLDTPKPTGNNSIGVWPSKTKFPGSADNIMVPADFKNKVPLKFDY